MNGEGSAIDEQGEQRDRHVGERVFAALFGLPFAGFGLLILRGQLIVGFNLGSALITAVALTPAALALWFAFLGHREPHRAIVLTGLLGGVIVGGIGFLAGFVGPIIFTPEANQGPLLGIFVTGPLGFAVGAAGGLVVGALRRPAL